MHDFAGWTADEIRSIDAPALLVIGDRDFVRLGHAAEMLELFPDGRLAVLPDTRHTEVKQRAEVLRALVESFLAQRAGQRATGAQDVAASRTQPHDHRMGLRPVGSFLAWAIARVSGQGEVGPGRRQMFGANRWGAPDDCLKARGHG